jgi:hypothetical protein
MLVCNKEDSRIRIVLVNTKEHLSVAANDDVGQIGWSFWTVFRGYIPDISGNKDRSKVMKLVNTGHMYGKIEHVQDILKTCGCL